VWDRQGNHFLVFDIDGTREAASPRALPNTQDRPAPQRRLRPLCAPGSTLRKRGEVVRTRTTVLQAQTHQWLATFENPGNGEYRAELRRAVAIIRGYLKAHHHPAEHALLPLDGQYGTGAVLADLAGLAYVMRGKDSEILKRAEIQARLKLPPDQHLTHPESGMVRALYDCPDLPRGPEGMRCRLVVATHPAGAAKSRIGVTRSGVVYELFLTNLPQSAFTEALVVALYLHRGAFENALADEDLEQDPDRWCSHTPCGQETWQIISQWVWNEAPGVGPSARLSIRCAPPSLLLLSHLCKRRLSRLLPLRGMGRQKLPCPGNKVASRGKTFPFSRMERSVVPPDSRLWRTSGAGKLMGACAWSMRPASAVVVPVPYANSANGMAALPPSRAFVSVLLHPLVVGSAPLRLSRLEPSVLPTCVLPAAAPSMRRGRGRASHLRQPRCQAWAPFPCPTGTLSALVGRTAGSQCASRNFWSGGDQTVRRDIRLCHLARRG
jgi:hypothetical protein